MASITDAYIERWDHIYNLQNVSSFEKFSTFWFTSLLSWVCSNEDRWIFLVTVLFFSLLIYKTKRGIAVKSDKKIKTDLVWFQERQSNISCHYFVFFPFSFFGLIGVCSDKTAEYFSSLFLFYFFFLSWRNWVYSDKTAEYFSSLFCFFFFFSLSTILRAR